MCTLWIRTKMMNTGKMLSKKIGYSIFAFAGMFCAFLWKAERDLAASGNLIWTGNYVLQILLFSVLVGGLVGVGICFVVYQSTQRHAGQKTLNIEKKGIEKWLTDVSERRIYGISLILIILSWIPCYLAYYPGICSYDTTIQLEQIVKESFNDHHPIAHTLLLRAAMWLGDNLFGNVTTGVGIFVAGQMIFLAAAFAYSITLLYRFRVRKIWSVLLLLYSMFYPFHWYMSVTTIKDTLFSAFFLLQMVAFCVLLAQGEKIAWNSRYTLLL